MPAKASWRRPASGSYLPIITSSPGATTVGQLTKLFGESGRDTHKVRVRNQGLTSPVLGTGNPRSSSCHKNPNEEPNVTGDSDNTGKAVFEHVEATETALDFDPDEGSGRSVFSEEEGVTGAAIDGCEEHDQEPERIPSKAENPPITPTPLSPKLTEQDVREWLDRNVSELPQEFEISNLINWT